jgi:uncharacterized protein YndB with AHSA1/START domain
MEKQQTKEVTLTRILNAPRELVFKAWTDPKELAKWWGPHGFTAPVCEVDLRPGGKLRINMHAPQLGFPDHWMTGVFQEIIAPARLVFTSKAFEDENGNAPLEIINTITFDDLDGKTKLTVHAVVTRATPEMAPALAGMEMGWSQSLEKLAQLLTGPIVIERTLKAPIEKVWKAITDEGQMKQWYFDLPGFRPEAGYEFEFYGGPDEKKYRHMCKITEVVTGKKLAYSWRYDGYEGNSLVTFELFAEGENTRVKLTHAGLDTFPANNPDLARHNFEQGWTQIIGTSLKEFLEKA